MKRSSSKTFHNKTSFQIALSGAPSLEGVIDAESLDRSFEFGKAMHARAISGAMATTLQGFPLWVSRGLGESKISTIGFSGYGSKEESPVFDQELSGHYDTVIYTGFGNTGAGLMAIKSSDIVIFGPGSMASILECTAAIEHKKVIGILTGPWKIDDVLRSLLHNHYPDYPHVFHSDDPGTLLDGVIKRARILDR